MATFVVEARVASPGGSWTTVSEVIAFVFRKEVNNLYRAEVTVVNPPTAVEALLVRDNEIRIRDMDVPKEWYRGKIRDVTADPLTSIFNVSALGVAVVLHDRSWIGRREFPVVPAEISADELAHSLNGEPRAGQVLYFDMETLTNDSPAKMSDLSGSGNDGVITGTVSAVVKWGLGRDFPNPAGGTASHRINVTLASGIDLSVGMSMSFFISVDTLAVQQNFVRFENIASGRIVQPFMASNNEIRIADSNATNGTGILMSAGRVYHVGIVYTGTRKRCYIDGVERFDVATTFTDTLERLRAIGCSVTSVATDGQFDDFYLYDRALSADEIKVLAGRNILPGHNGTMDSFTAIGFRSEEEKRGVTIETLARSVGAEVFVDQNASDENRFNFVDRIGSASPTDTFEFGETAVLASRKVDSESIYNDITVLGYGDGINQLKSRNFHATTIRSTVAIRQTASASTLDLASAASYPTSGIIQVGRERERYTGKTANQLTGISGANRAYTADGYESIAAYAHEVGIEVFLHADTTTSPATYYTPEVPQTGSSIDDNGWRQAPYPAPELVDQNATDRLAQRFLAKYKDERESVVLHVYEEAIIADLGDDVDVQNLDGSAYENSPYRIIAVEFKWPASKWELELANYRDTLDRRMAELGEKLRIANEFGQGATNFYPLYVQENVKGGARVAVMDVTIPAEALAVNRVKITNLRLRSFENYASVSAGGQAPTSANEPDSTNTTLNETQSAVSGVGVTAGWVAGPVITLPTHDDSTGYFCIIEQHSDGFLSLHQAKCRVVLGGGATGTFPGTNGLNLVIDGDNEELNDGVIFIPKDLALNNTITAEVNHDGAGSLHGVTVRLTVYGISKHTHDVTIASHSHPADIVPTAYTSPSVSIFIDGVDKTSVVKPAGPYTTDTSNIDLTDAIAWTQGVHTVEFREGATDKLGRIHASGFVKTFLKS